MVARVTPVHIPCGGLRLQATPVAFQTALDADEGASEDPPIGEARPTRAVVRSVGPALIVGVATIVRPGLGQPIGRLAGRPRQSNAAAPATGVRHAKVVAVARPA